MSTSGKVAPPKNNYSDITSRKERKSWQAKVIAVKLQVHFKERCERM